MITRKGFTLIEMLVVIAIIGILSAAVLVSLGPSRDKAKDARIVSALEQARILWETNYDATSAMYPDLSAIGQFSQLENDINANGGSVIGGAGGNAAAVASQLNAGGAFCVDTSGFSGYLPTVPGTVGPTCP